MSGLSIGSVALDPSFNGAVQVYTATTTNDADKVTATPTDTEHTTVSIKLGTTDIENGADVTWGEGENTLTITVSATGNTPTTYTVTVTKSEEQTQGD